MGNLNNENKIGPKIDPWGTPHKSAAVDEENSPIWTEKHTSEEKCI